jgi:hypothetical protein
MSIFFNPQFQQDFGRSRRSNCQQRFHQLSYTSSTNWESSPIFDHIDMSRQPTLIIDGGDFVIIF